MNNKICCKRSWIHHRSRNCSFTSHCFSFFPFLILLDENWLETDFCLSSRSHVAIERFPSRWRYEWRSCTRTDEFVWRHPHFESKACWFNRMSCRCVNVGRYLESLSNSRKTYSLEGSSNFDRASLAVTWACCSRTHRSHSNFKFLTTNAMSIVTPTFGLIRTCKVLCVFRVSINWSLTWFRVWIRLILRPCLPMNSPTVAALVKSDRVISSGLRSARRFFWRALASIGAVGYIFSLILRDACRVCVWSSSAFTLVNALIRGHPSTEHFSTRCRTWTASKISLPLSPSLFCLTTVSKSNNSPINALSLDKYLFERRLKLGELYS